LISAPIADCGAVTALSSSAAERGIANAMVAAAISARIIDKNQEKTYIAATSQETRRQNRRP
jgi:hypothetical protein